MRKLALLLAVTLIAGCSACVSTEPTKRAPVKALKDGSEECVPEPIYPYIYPCKTGYGFTLSSG